MESNSVHHMLLSQLPKESIDIVFEVEFTNRQLVRSWTRQLTSTHCVGLKTVFQAQKIGAVGDAMWQSYYQFILSAILVKWTQVRSLRKAVC